MSKRNHSQFFQSSDSVYVPVEHTYQPSKARKVAHVLNFFNPFKWLSACEDHLNKDIGKDGVYRAPIRL